MIVITVKQPWAYLIAAGIKDIENRTWKCPQKYIGKRILIHASAKPIDKFSQCLTKRQEIDFKNKSNIPYDYNKNLWVYNHLEYACNHCNGSIIGSVEIVDCVVNHTSIWAEKTAGSNCPLCHRVIESKKEDRQFCVDCRRVLDKGIDYYDTIYNWVISNPILFDEPVLGIKGKLGFWDYEV